MQSVLIRMNNNNEKSYDLSQQEYQNCFLLPNNFGVNATWIQVNIQSGYNNTYKGFGSIMGYAYESKMIKLAN